MIYLRNAIYPQVMFVPRNGTNLDKDLVLKVRSTIDLDEVVNQGVIDLGTSDLYFNLAVELPAGLPDGEYEYSLMAGNDILSSGLLVIGDYTKPSEYNKEIIYEQYETE